MKILFDNKLNNASISASSTDDNYPVSNLKHPFLRKRWQSTLQSDILTNTFSSTSIDSVYVGHKNRKAFVKVYKPGYTFYSQSGTVTDDIGGVTFDGSNSDKIEVELRDDFVTNGEFADGTTGWTLGVGSKVRQQGWVCKVPTGDFFRTDDVITGVPTNPTLIISAFSWDTLVCTSVDIKIRTSNSGGSSLGDTSITYTSADTGGYVVKSATGTMPATADRARIDVVFNGYTSGACRVGFIYGTVNGLPLTTNWDFADGSETWQSVTDQEFVYDPQNAYIGNALPGGSGNTLVLTELTNSQDSNVVQAEFPVVPGEQYIAEAFAKTINPAGFLAYYSIFTYNSSGGLVASPLWSWSASATDWTKQSITYTIPANAVTAQVRTAIGGTLARESLWLVGGVSVEKVVTDKAYLGGIGIGEPYSMKPPSSFWEEGFDDRSIVSESDSGQVLQEYSEPLKFYNWTFEVMDRTITRIFQSLYALSGRGKALWIEPETDAIPVLYGRIVEAIQTTKDKRRYTTKMGIKEAR